MWMPVVRPVRSSACSKIRRSGFSMPTRPESMIAANGAASPISSRSSAEPALRVREHGHGGPRGRQRTGQLDHVQDGPAPQVHAGLLRPEPVHEPGPGRAGPIEQGLHQLAPRVAVVAIDQLVIAAPGGWGGGAQRRGIGRDTALGEPPREQLEVQIDDRLAGVERDERLQAALVSQGWSRGYTAAHVRWPSRLRPGSRSRDRVERRRPDDPGVPHPGGRADARARAARQHDRRSDQPPARASRGGTTASW